MSDTTQSELKPLFLGKVSIWTVFKFILIVQLVEFFLIASLREKIHRSDKDMIERTQYIIEYLDYQNSKIDSLKRLGPFE